MIDILLAFALACSTTDADAEALRRTAPSYFAGVDDARAHVIAARFAGAYYQVRADRLLAIAHHESRYTVGVVTHEPGGRVSCGVMTPRPQARCSSDELTLIGGYLAGARHLREWTDVCNGNELCALNGYAGNSMDGQGSGLATWQAFERRARWITAEMHR